MFKIDREKYISLAKESGLSAAITALHHDTKEWEFETFEGQAGYQPEMLKVLESVREFSRELWTLNQTIPTLVTKK